MARELNYTIGDIFRGQTTTRGVSYWGRNTVIVDSPKVYMDIPIKKSIFEIPTFALGTFFSTLENKRFDEEAIVAVLRTINKVPRYVTLNRYMRDILIDDYDSNRLVKLEIKEGETEPLVYYATHGMILDYQFTPVMMCSWLIERTIDYDGNFKYEFLKPIMRIDPACYLSRGNSMERFIVNKLPIVALDSTIYQPYRRNVPSCFVNRQYSDVEADLRIEIDKCPFVLKQSDVPSISTTNEKLLQIAIDHIDEIIQ